MSRDLINYFDCIGTGADNITHGFNFCTAIDIGNHVYMIGAILNLPVMASLGGGGGGGGPAVTTLPMYSYSVRFPDLYN
jgi:hypothetical protein